MAAFNQNPLGQPNVGLALSTITLGIGTINPSRLITNYDVISDFVAEGRTLNSITIPIDLRPKVGLLYPR
jgi:hypothetical protein